MSSYSLYIIITARRIPVPLDRAPVKSARAAKKPTVTAPITVNGLMYLESICSTTLSSLLNPGTCNPDAIICLACDLASIPDVWTQNIENMTEPIIINATYTNDFKIFMLIKLPVSRSWIIFGEYIHATIPATGTLPENVPNKG